MNPVVVRLECLKIARELLGPLPKQDALLELAEKLIAFVLVGGR